jgi:hypothetical protein
MLNDKTIQVTLSTLVEDTEKDAVPASSSTLNTQSAYLIALLIIKMKKYRTCVFLGGGRRGFWDSECPSIALH